MVFFRLTGFPFSEQELFEKLAERNILINEADDHVFRVVTHYWVTKEDAAQLIRTLVSIGESV